MRRHGPRYEVVASFDTETSNHSYVDEAGETRRCAWCVLYTFEDLRGCGLRRYVPGAGETRLLRHADEAIAFIEELIAWGRERGVVPVVAGYNLMFDLQTLLFELNARYPMGATAQSSTNAYVVDLLDEEGGRVPLLRFWDTFHLEMRGLAAMGETAGVRKLDGDWDYDLLRTPETPLTEEERAYAAFDVHIIPAYLRHLLEANSWMSATDLACQVMTKTSIVRTFSKREIGSLSFETEGGRRVTLMASFLQLCAQEFWEGFDQYALQRACFRGGFTFTAGRFASQVVRRVHSMDETSAHHFLINGRQVPVGFRRVSAPALQAVCESIVGTPLASVLSCYDRPWLYGMHARVRFRALRLREGSAFERWGIALIPQGKFALYEAPRTLDSVPDSPRNEAAEADVKAAGYRDVATNPTFAFSKLVSADSCEIHVSEVELYAISRVYSWDSMEAVSGEVAVSWVTPPDYVTLQSNVLFAQKQGMKALLKTYEEGVPYEGEMDPRIPEAIRAECMAGVADRDFLEAYYNSTVKGMFNGIYGVQSQNVMRPDYMVRDGDLEVDDETRVTRENFHEREPRRKKVLYTYGLRIVGGSRLQLVLAIEALWRALGESVRVVGGDTDSLKVSCDEGVGPSELLAALGPLHEATSAAIERTQRRVRECFPDYVADLDGVGEFEVENAAPYPLHVELWNKARVTGDGSRAHVTCAGLSRPRGEYTIEDAIGECVARGMGFGDAVNVCLGYNTFVGNSVSHALERTRPRARDRVRLIVTDHLGVERAIDLPEAICLYGAPRNVADTTKRSNLCNVRYLRAHGVSVDTSEKMVQLRCVNGVQSLQVERIGTNGWESVL